VSITIDSGASLARGPEVRAQMLRIRPSEGPPDAVVELHRFGGTLRDGAGQPVANAWVALPDSGLWTATDRHGRFVLNRVRTGTHPLVVRTLSGDELSVDVTIPGERVDLVVGASAGGARVRKRHSRE
jgi:hypothetical protein